jgi:hypothetical protein
MRATGILTKPFTLVELQDAVTPGARGGPAGGYGLRPLPLVLCSPPLCPSRLEPQIGQCSHPVQTMDNPAGIRALDEAPTKTRS